MKKMIEYLSDQITQHRDLEQVWKQKWFNAQKIQHKNRYFISFKRHEEAADVLERAIAKAKNIGGIK
jgi:DNA-binding transcriptional regulator WhiA